MRLLAAAGAPTELDPVAEWIGAVVRGEAHAPGAPGPLRHDDAELLPRWASAGDDEVVARLLDAGVPIDARGIDDGTALHYAGMWGRPSTVALLLDRGADVDAASAHGTGARLDGLGLARAARRGGAPRRRTSRRRGCFSPPARASSRA